MNNAPNLFSYATSELSQDAFICWLLAWAKPEHRNANPALTACATDILRKFFSLHGKDLPGTLNEVAIHKQHRNIDVLVIVNGDYPIIIEDKTATKEHSDQLERYVGQIEGSNYDNEKILPIYFKTHDQSSYAKVKSAGYEVFGREDFLRILNTHAPNIDNAVFQDYRDHLQELDDKVNSYKTLPIKDWHWYSWIGFYRHLKKELSVANNREPHWEYVANQAGGFLGLWWYFHQDKNDDCEVYLQLEQSRLCFKIASNDKSNRGSQRSKWHSQLRDRAREFNLDLTKPKRFGNGTWMTVAIPGDKDGAYIATDTDGVLDFISTLNYLQKAEKLVASFFE